MNGVITGAGSGVGRAVAIMLAKAGWNLALVGRRAELLQETAELATQPGVKILIYPGDVGNEAAVQELGQKVLAEFGTVELLVNGAGTNTPARSLEVVSPSGYHHLMDTNLNGAYYCTQAFLPAMRQAKSGTIVNIVSEAGLRASPKAGVAYVISKFGMAGLTQAINAEERTNGIRACSVFPGDIDTPILDFRPSPPSAEARLNMLQPEDVAECVLLAVNLPARAIVEEIVVRPR